MPSIFEPDLAVETFFTHLSIPDQEARRHWFTYIAVKHEGRFIILAGKLVINVKAEVAQRGPIESTAVLSDTVDIATLGLTPRDLVDQLLCGRLTLGERSFDFLRNPHSQSVEYRPDVHYAHGSRRIEHMLILVGPQRGDAIDYPAVDRALSAAKGFHGTWAQLLTDHGFDLRWGAASVWIVNAPVVEVLPACRDSAKRKAQISIRLRRGFDVGQASVALTFIGKTGPQPPRSLTGDQFDWKQRGNDLIGTAAIAAPLGADLKVVGLYGDESQHTRIFRLTNGSLIDEKVLNPIDAIYFGGVDLNTLTTVLRAKEPDEERGKILRQKPSRKRSPARPSLATKLQLHALSRNECAYPDCRQNIYANGTRFGHVCHIRAAKPDAPRYLASQTPEQRHGFDNLILLCTKHHALVDQNPIDYDVGRLLEMKRAHESSSQAKPDN
jgi:hypothetical protein